MDEMLPSHADEKALLDDHEEDQHNEEVKEFKPSSNECACIHVVHGEIV